MWKSPLILVLTVWASLVSQASQNTRNKRQILSEQPRLITQNGHLIIQSGTNHNITFRSGGNSGIYMNNVEVNSMLSQVNYNRLNISRQLTQIRQQDSRLSALRILLNARTNAFNSTLRQLQVSVTAVRALSQSESDARRQIDSQIEAINRRLSALESTLSTVQQQLTVNDCSSGTQCLNGGTCIDLYQDYYCICPSNWQGRRCDTDVNECQLFIGTVDGCQNGATCINSPGSYSCQCTHDWYGVRCTEQHDDCQGSNSQRCGQGTCVNQQRTQPGLPSYTCACFTGYTLSTISGLPFCVDVDECSPTSGYRYPCSTVPHVSCINVPGSFHCGPCPQGYDGNGTYCSLSDRCRINNGGCHPNAQCHAPSGYAVTCICNNGYVGNGFGPNGCIPQSSSAACMSSPCLNGGICIPHGLNSYVCSCPLGFGGPTCDSIVTACASSPCLNNGICIAQNSNYICNCTTAYTGYNCERQQQECGLLEGEMGTLKYPRDDYTYGHNVVCTHHITTTQGKVLKLNFTNFNIEYDSSCYYDYLQVFDGPSSQSLSLGKYCGTSLNRRILRSTQNQITLHFESDESVTHAGFQLLWTSEVPACGGLLSGQSTGTINSPQYPMNFPPQTNCVWVITVTPGKSIAFRLDQIDLSCSNAYIDIRDGEADSASLLQRICGSNTPSRVVTTGPSAFIRFYSNYTAPHQGFSLTYRETGQSCGRALTGMSGTFNNPAVSVDGTRLCVWTITVPENNFIELKFPSFRQPCENSMLTVHDGNSFTAPILSRLCGDTAPSGLNSTGNTLHIEWRSDSTAAEDIFIAQWNGVCGRKYIGETGVIDISTTFYDTCVYSIEVPLGKSIFVAVTNVTSNLDEDCDFQLLSVYDGSSVSANIIRQTQCSESLPQYLRSSSNQMLMVLNSGNLGYTLQFTANYSAQDDTAVCGGVLNEPHGSLRSPRFPNVYDHGINCTWYITVDEGHLIKLIFHTFELEGHGCQYDFIDVYDGATVTEQRMGRYCGTTRPPELISSGNAIVVYMVTDSSVALSGFYASYLALNQSLVCGRTLTAPSGIITSPNYPNNYPSNKNCEWTITVGTGKQILLNISDFSLEQHYSCRYDYLEIRNGGFRTSPLLTKLCGYHSQIEPIKSHSNRLYLKFLTDISITSKGFYLEYSEVASGCGGELTAHTGSIESPNYPDPYPPNTLCQWKIHVAAGSKIIMTFDDHFHISCHYDHDYIEIQEGRSPSRQLCGPQAPSPITFLTNELMVIFRSNFYRSDIGFSANYHSECNNVLNGTQGVIESPNFPNLYPPSQQCSWAIQVPQGNKINAHFAFFNLEPDSSCRHDYVQITGSNLTASKLCGDQVPPNFISEQNHLNIAFQSDRSDSYPGFRLEWILSGCGESFTVNSGSFTSLNYPQPYSAGIICIWEITVDEGYIVKLTIEDIDLEFHNQCVFDALEIFSRSLDEVPIAKICHSQNTTQYVTTENNHMLVKFRTDHSISGRGFKANFTAVQRECGSDFSTFSGTLKSKNYPNNYGYGYYECGWLIQIQEDYIVKLTFSALDLDCPLDELQIYSGENEDGTLLGTACQLGTNTTNYLSGTNKMFVKMIVRSWSQTHTGFLASYTTTCGGTRNADVGGEIFSPINLRYGNCTWIITSSTNNIYLTFTEMNIPDWQGCSQGSVVVINGENNSTFCGSVLPHTVYTQGSSLQVTYTRGWYSNSGIGFRARYSSLLTSCGGDLQALRGRFASPHYPLDYPDDTECVWQITTPPGNKLEINFLEFRLTGGRNNDYVEIHAPDVNGQVLGRWFGDNLPSNITQLQGAWILFRSDDQGHSSGFVADFTKSCGGELRGINGQIASLNYLSKYLPSLNCLWTIQVQQNMKIKITFNSFEIEGPSPNCYHDYILIFEGDVDSGTEIGKFCGSEVPGAVYSSSNEVTIKFVTDYSFELSGFLLTWEEVSSWMIPPPPVPGCGGNLTAGSAENVLTSPGYPSSYINRLDCFWIISAPVGKTVLVKFQNISLEGVGFHCFDYLSFYDGISISSPSITDRICQLDENSNSVKSTSNILGVLFHSDFSVTNTGFSFTYKEDCGGFVAGVSTGIIQSTNYSNNYPENQNCTWKVIVRIGKTIRLQFSEPFNIVNAASCQSDYLKLYNGPSLSSPPLLVNGSLNVDGIYCGQTAPQGLETSSNELFVQFVSDGSNSGAGFSFTFTEVSLACGGTLTLSTSSSTGNFSSPNYPGEYPHNVDCIWRILAPASKRIRVDILEPFFIEPHPRCLYDYIEFHDGGTAIAPVIGEPFCGTHLPSTIYSSSNVLLARFRTDDSLAHAGFNARYSIATCGGRIRSGNGTITSPNFPSNYNPNVECEWEVIGTVGHYITFTFITNRLTHSYPCVDFVEIRDGNATDTVIYNSCNDLQMSVDTSDSRAYVRFKSGGTISSQGFKLNFQSSLEECGGHLYDSTGVIMSPNFPNLYAHNRVCVWEIEVAADRSISLTFTDFALENHTFCRFDYVQVFNGIEPDSPSLGRFCGEVIPPVLQSTGNTMKITFKTDVSASHNGFKAIYSSDNNIVCGGTLTELTGVMTSPQDNSTVHKVQCIWLISNHALLESSVRLSFLIFDLEAHGSCDFDVLEIREGVDRTGQLIGRYCGNSKPDDILIPGGDVWIMYKTDQSFSSVGFNLTYTVSDCGGYRDSQGTIIAPALSDGSYTKACVWKIQAPEGNKIKILPSNFNLSCADGYLSIQNGGFPDSPLIGNYCNPSTPSNFTSQSNELRIKTILNGSLAGQTGFNLQYTFESGGCGGIHHGVNGTIMSPNYPRSYPHDTECKWEIHVEQGYFVNLQFNLRFDMAAHDNCEHDFVQVIDVIQDGTEVSLGKWCSNQVPQMQNSSSSKMKVIFRSDHTTNGLGFAADWKRVCGGRFTAEAGNVYSPGYPRNYPNNVECNYKISPGANKLISLRFIDLQLDSREPQFYYRRYYHYCRGDRIVVKKNSLFAWYYPEVVCRLDNLRTFESQSWMELTFNSDSSRTDRGFHAQYEAMDCGGNLTNSSGRISSHPFHGNFTGVSECFWYITVDPSKVIQLKFTALNFSTSDDCWNSYIQIYDGQNSSSPSMGRFCNILTASDVLRSSTNSLTLSYRIGYYALSLPRAFQADYWSTYGPAAGCGGRFNQSQGTFTSLDIDNNRRYEPDMNCLWYITVAQDKVISLNITDINIDGQTPCENDYLVVYDGLQEHELGRYCGSLSPVTLLSTTNEVTVSFVSDSVSSSSGFRITYAERDRPCGGFYNATFESQIISSPNYPNTYGQPVMCTWIIDSGTSDNETKVNITDRVCSDGASIYVSDKPLNVNGQRVNLCDPSINEPFYSIYRQARIFYNGTNNSKFQLTFAIADCNRNYSQPSGRIISSGFPFKYRHNAICTYGIHTAENTSVAIYFRRFDVEYHPYCGFDYLQVQNSSSSSLGKFCGAIVPSPVFLTDNVATLVFKTDYSVTKKGFDVIYISSTQGPGCGGNLTGLNFGIFTSPGYPRNSSVAQTCSWLISPHSTLLFQYVQMSPSSNCNTDYVAVYQGSTVEGSLISHYCNEVRTISPRQFSSTILVRYVSSGNATAPVFKFLYAPTLGEL